MVEQKSLRAIAKLVAISTLYTGQYITGNENAASVLRLDSGEEIIRINIIGTLVTREDLGSITIFRLDDGGDSINLRFFETSKKLDLLQIGSVVLVVGRLREYNSERYVAVEIIKLISPRWLKYRSLLLQNVLGQSETIPSLKQTEAIEKERAKPLIAQKKGPTVPFESVVNTLDDAPSASDTNGNSTQENPYSGLMALIEKLDTGTGVGIEIVISESEIVNTRELLQKMMESGDIFQNMPGKVKVL